MSKFLLVFYLLLLVQKKFKLLQILVHSILLTKLKVYVWADLKKLILLVY